MIPGLRHRDLDYDAALEGTPLSQLDKLKKRSLDGVEVPRRKQSKFLIRRSRFHSLSIELSDSLDPKMEAEWGKMRVDQLKIELMKIGAKTTGRKSELIERLGDYHRNSNFKGPSISLPGQEPMPNWPVSGFKSVTPEGRNGLPKVLNEHVEFYIVTRQVLDKKNSCDHAAMRRGKKMADCVDALSFLSTYELVFFTGIVYAEMKKNLAYNIKFIIDARTGQVKNSECECPAGKGPTATCKHVVSALLLLVEFTDGGELRIRKSCTETLQTFKKPKHAHKASPLKVQGLKKLMKRKSRKEIDGEDDDDDPDPRLLEDRKRPSYTDEVRNITTNFCSQFSQDISLRYSYGKANFQAAISDHDYLDKKFPEY